LGRRKAKAPSAGAARVRKHRAKVPERDTGTAELAAQKLRAVLWKGKAGDPALSTHPLDIAMSQGQINPRQNEAGWILYRLRARVVGKHECRAARLEEYIGAGSVADEYVADIAGDQLRMRRYFEADRELQRLGWRTYHATRQLVLGHGIGVALIGPARRGLQRLAELFKVA